MRQPSVAAERVARWTIAVYVIVSVFDLAWLPVRRAPRDVGWVDVVIDVLNLPVLANLPGVLALFLLTGALLRRKRFALYLVVATQVLGVALAVWLGVHHLTGLRLRPLIGANPDAATTIEIILGGVFGAFAAVVLVRARAAFPARRSPGSRSATLLTAVAGLAFSAGVAILLAEVSRTETERRGVAVVVGLRAALGLDVLLPPPPHAPRLTGWEQSVVSLLSALAILVAVAVFLRSSRGPKTLDEAEELRVRQLLAASAHPDSLGYFATRRDRSVIFSPDGRAGVSYRVIASVSLAAADPLGDPASWPAAIAAWKAQARRFGWVPAALSPGREAALAYAGAGLHPIPLGDEAIIDGDGFTLNGPAMRGVRQAVLRVRRAGYRISVSRHRDLSPVELADLAGLADRWRGDAPERGFSMALSRLGDPIDGDAVVVMARRPDGSPAGLLSLVPWGRRDVSLDVMRRDKQGANGLVEAMVTTLLERRAEFGIGRVSLNFAMFRSIFAAADEFGAGPVTRLNNAVLGFFSRFFQLESLYRSNAKYQPRWVMRYLMIDSLASLPRVALAAGMAEGFVPHRRRMPPERPASPALLAEVARLAAATAPSVRTSRRTDQERARHTRLDRLLAAGMPAYPGQVPRSGPLSDLAAAPQGTRVDAVGRVAALREFGGVCFADLVGDGARLQVVLDRATVPRPLFDLWRRAVDRGDLVGVSGTLGPSRTGQLSLLAHRWQMAAKALRPLPVTRSGLTEPEARLRDRSADLLVNPGAAAMVAVRSRAVQALRSAVLDAGFAEVETPILQLTHGGAAARPFTTHINAYHRNLSLRIAPELFLKRLVVGGVGPIFELGRNFRNEGVDATHNPEFTSLEAYQPFADYHDMRRLTTLVLQQVATALYGSPVARRVNADGRPFEFDLGGIWPAIGVHAAVGRACGHAVSPDTTVGEMSELAALHAISLADGATAGEIVLELYERLVEPATESPTYYFDFPVETSPLTRPHRNDPRLAERWDLVAFGMEIGTAYSELTDPIEQRARLTAQSLRAAAGDPTAMELDEDFLRALELGMPPTGGLGLGVDRMVMMLTGKPIRAVLNFPFIRP